MLALLHFRGTASPPSGLWWMDEDNSKDVPHSTYASTEELAERAGRTVMSNFLPGVTWKTFVRHLADQLPYFDVWMPVELDGTVDPSDYLTMMRDEAQKTLDSTDT